MKRKLSLLLVVAFLMTTLTGLSAFAGEASETESPMLAAQVAEGTLPPLAERLPIASDIMIEDVEPDLGKLGGSITLHSSDNGRWSAWGYISEQSMFRFKQDGSGEVEANVCKEFFPNEDSTIWTIKLREGMRWSDGALFTADDIIFYYDHMSTPALNEDRSAVDAETEGYYSVYTSKPYSCYQVDIDGTRYWAEFTKVNDYEFTVTFAAPKPAFAADAAVDNKWMFLPKHFYVNYVSRKDGVADDADFPFITEDEAIANGNSAFGKQWDSYSTMAKDIGYYHWDYHIVPQLRSFIALKDNWNAIGETYELVRNPYFWKTDSEGKQLPYLDSVKFKIINEADQVTLAASAGEFDIIDPSDFAIVATSLQHSHTLIPWPTPSWSTDEMIQLNQTVKDLDKRALFQDKKFRQALSIAVDRNLLNETLRNGITKPQQAAVGEGLIGYDPEWSAKWTEYDIAAANALLDEITEPWDGAEGTYRKMKGTDKDVEIILTIRDASANGDFVSLLQSAYKAIGVKLSDKVDAEARTALLSNDVEASIEGVSVSTPSLRPDAIVPIRNVSFWHSAYGKWYEDGKTEATGGIAPEGDILKLIEAYDRMKAAAGPDRDEVVAECVQEIYDLHKENVWIIGYLAPIPSRFLVNNRLHNFPTGLLGVDEFRYLGLAHPEQWWVDQ